MGMKKKLLKTLEQLRTEEINLKETPALFKWSYEEEPFIEFQLLIKEVDQQELQLESNELH